MAQVTISVPSMYGDHHVLEVRRLLLALPGVKAVDASSAFQVVEVEYDEKVQNEETIRNTLGEAGYLEPLPVPAESGVAVTETEGAPAYFRHTEAYTQTKDTIGFAQQVQPAPKALWPCPGFGTLPSMDE